MCFRSLCISCQEESFATTDMPRKKLNADQRRSVLEEFSYLCAICGQRRPHIHHIDGYNSNDDAMNLIPLCPNHHLTDSHDPTRPLPPELLTLLRKYRDPFILHPRFFPIYARLSAFYNKQAKFSDLAQTAEDIVAFLRPFSMGQYYSEAINNVFTVFFSIESEDILDVRYAAVLARAEELLVEMLRYQGWSQDELP
jgi:hypothetical protein